MQIENSYCIWLLATPGKPSLLRCPTVDGCQTFNTQLVFPQSKIAGMQRIPKLDKSTCCLKLLNYLILNTAAHLLPGAKNAPKQLKSDMIVKNSKELGKRSDWTSLSFFTSHQRGDQMMESPRYSLVGVSLKRIIDPLLVMCLITRVGV